MIAAEAFGKGLSALSLVEHAADADAVQMGGFDAESDDSNGRCRRRETGVRIRPTTKQAKKAPVATPSPSTDSATHRSA